MTTIFIGGSRDIAAIPASIARRIDSIMERGHDVIVGDAPGADAAVQRYMQASNYQQVIVFCSGRRRRNNLGAWPTRPITPPADARGGFQFYAAKDQAMAQSADFGLMLWDGRSIGTLANTMRLTRAGKATVLFDASRGHTINIRTFEQWNDFAGTISRALLDTLNSRLASEGLLDNLRRQDPKPVAPRPPPTADAAASARPAPMPDATAANAPSPARGLRHELGGFTVDRMQPRRDASANEVRVVSKRRERSAIQALPDETVIDVDRTHPVLGNRHYLRDHNNDRERAAVIAAHKRDFEADVARNGPMSRAIDAIVARVQRGEKLALRCWCAPRPCHADTYRAEIVKRLAAAAPTAPTATPDTAAPKAPPPAGGVPDKLAAFTADRMQPRRDAEQIKGATQSGRAVLASLEALEKQETTGIFARIRGAAQVNGGVEHVLSEMRPGGAFEDLRKEFNVVISHDKSFAAAYETAAGALSTYAETRAAMISTPRLSPDVNLARLETLDQEIGAAAKRLPGLEDGKNALDEALEGGKEAVEKASSAIRQAFTADADARGPSPNPGLGP